MFRGGDKAKWKNHEIAVIPIRWRQFHPIFSRFDNLKTEEKGVLTTRSPMRRKICHKKEEISLKKNSGTPLLAVKHGTIFYVAVKS